MAMLASIGPVYLPLMIVLWLLILRGVSLELRNHTEWGRQRRSGPVSLYLSAFSNQEK